jgi:hypothetical protein
VLDSPRMLEQKAAALHVQQLLARLAGLIGTGGAKLDTAGAPASAAGVLLLLAGVLRLLTVRTAVALLTECKHSAAAAFRTSCVAAAR